MTAVVVYDWLARLAEIVELQEREWGRMAEAVGFELVAGMSVGAIEGVLRNYPRREYRMVLTWVLGWMGKRALPVLWVLAEDDNQDVAGEAARWIAELQPMPKTPAVICLPGPSIQPMLPGLELQPRMPGF